MSKPLLCRLLFVLTLLPGSMAWAEGNCWVVAIAMNQDAAASEDWNQYGEEFALVFQEHAKPMFRSVQAKTVLGKQARLNQITAALRWAATSARPNDFVAIYVTAHGGTSGKDGWGFDTMDGQTIWGRDMKSMAAKAPCPVLFVIDSCGSGGFARERAKDVPLPPNCVAICSSRARQSTTNSLNIALHEALWGIADSNHDKFVDVDETVRYIHMRIHKMAPPEASAKELELPVIVVGSNVSADLKLTKVSGKLVAIPQGGQWHLGRVTSEQSDICKVHLMGYQDIPDKGFFFFNEAPKQRIFQFDDATQPVLVKNSDNDKVRPALLVGVEGDQFKVRYVQVKKGKEELVGKALVRFPFSNREGLNAKP